MKIEGRFNAFWKKLKAILTAAPSTSTVFNQYRDWNDEVDLPEAANIRIENLRQYMAEATLTASILVVGEAAGPWGCRFSGIPFTGERQLLDHSVPIRGERSSKETPNRSTKFAPPYISQSAKIFWSVMRPYYKRFLLWDAFPLHSHKRDDVLTVRNPTRKEVAQFREALRLIMKHRNLTDIVAVGRKAEKEIKSLGERVIYVRHPSRGGKTEFAAGMQEIFENKTRKRQQTDTDNGGYSAALSTCWTATGDKSMKRNQTSDEVREKILSAFPKETGNLFHNLWTNVAHLHLNWENYRSLFGTSPERIDLLRWAASSFFGLLDRILRHNVMLAIARLMDHPRSAGKDNASLARLIDMLKDTVLFDELWSELKDLKALCEPLLQIRNRLLAHSDLSTALQYHTDPLPGISRDYIEEVLEKIRKLLGKIEEHFLGSRTSQYVISSGDGESLIFALESAREHEKCRRREFNQK